MLPKFYYISQENFENNFNYFNTTNSRIVKSLKCLSKFKDCTSDYCSKISKLFKKENDIIEDYEIIEKKDSLDDKNNIKNEAKNSDLIKNFLFPVDGCIEIMFNFLDKFAINLNDYINYVEKQLKEIEQYSDAITGSLNSLKYNYDNQQIIFQSKYNKYQNLNTELKNNYYKGEQKLIQFCHDTDIDGITLDINYTLNFADIYQKQNEILEKYKALGNYEKTFFDSSKENINLIQEIIIDIFRKFESFSKNISFMFNKYILSPLNLLIEENAKDFEADLNKDLNFLNDNFKQNIDENNIKLKLDEYNITVLDNNIIEIGKKDEENKDKKEKEKEKEKEKHKKKEKNNDKKNEKTPSNNSSNQEKKILTEEEIFFIVRNMYQDYKFINKDKYDLKIEEKKLGLKSLIKKLLSFSNKVSLLFNPGKKLEDETKKEENNQNEKKEITQEEVAQLCKEMSNEESRKYFLIQINNFRSLGNLSMPKNIYDYFTQILKEISKHLLISDENSENKGHIKDFQASKLITILAQTFYYLEGKEKIYLSEELKNVEVFRNPNYWIDIISSMIEAEIGAFSEKKKILSPNSDENRIKNLKEEIYLAQIVPFVGSMGGFGLTKETMKNIISELVKKYDISEQTSKDVMNMIDS